MTSLESRVRDIFNRIWTEGNAGGVYDAISHNLRRYDGPQRMRYGRESLVRDLVRGFAGRPGGGRSLDGLILREEGQDAGAAALAWSLSGKDEMPGETGLSFWYLSDGVVTEIWDAPGEPAASDEPLIDNCFRTPPGELERTDGQGSPRNPSFDGTALDSAEALVAYYRALWNRRDIGLIRRFFTADALVGLPDGSEAKGSAAVEEFVTGMLTALPDALYSIEDLIPGPDGSEAALRWTLQGTDASGRERIRIGGQSLLSLSAGKITGELIRLDRAATLMLFAI